MTFRSLATLLGGTPADIADTPAEPVGTRFVGFGEGLTSAIANRPHYALAENTDDLNARMAAFEVGGLDAAYDLGLVAVPGGGRVVTKDAGALETVSALATQYGEDIANAHFRANMLADAIGGGVGYDVPRSQTSGKGFLDRWRLNEAGDTVWAPGQAATLNLAAAGVTRVTIGGGGAFSDGAGSTEILMGDLMFIQGTVGDDGLYVISSIVDAVTVLVVRLDGTSPSFTANEVCTITGFRADFVTTDTRFTDRGVVVRGINGATAAMTVIGGRGTNPASGADRALAFRQTLVDGAPDSSVFSYFNDWGSFRYSGIPADIPGATDHDYESAGIRFGFDTNPGAPSLGIVCPGREDNISASLNFLQTALVTDLGTSARAGTIAGGEELTITGIAGSEDYLAAVGTIIQIITPVADAGFYRVSDKTAVDTYRLRDLAGNGVTLTNGAASVRMYRANMLGTGLLYTLGIAYRDDLSVPSHNDDVRSHAFFPAASGDGGSSIVLSSPEDGAGGNEFFFIRGIAAAGFSGGQADAETFQVTAAGDISGMGALYAGLGGTIENADLNITDAPLVVTNTDNEQARIEHDSGPLSSTGQLIARFRSGSTSISSDPMFTRIYIGNFGFSGAENTTLFIARNCWWDHGGSVWRYDSNEEPAALLGMGPGTFYSYHRLSFGAATWTSATFATRSMAVGATGVSSNYALRIAYAGVAWHQNVASGQVIEAGCTWPASFTGGAPTSTGTMVIAETGTTGADNVGNITAYGAVASKSTTAVVGLKRYNVELDASP